MQTILFSMLQTFLVDLRSDEYTNNFIKHQAVKHILFICSFVFSVECHLSESVWLLFLPWHHIYLQKSMYVGAVILIPSEIRHWPTTSTLIITPTPNNMTPTLPCWGHKMWVSFFWVFFPPVTKQAIFHSFGPSTIVQHSALEKRLKRLFSCAFLLIIFCFSF